MEQEQFQQEQEKSDEEISDEKQPEYGLIEGQQVYLGGLDYSLLKQQSQNDKKKGFIDQIKLQLSNLQKKIDSKSVKMQKGQAQLDQKSLNLISTIKQLKHKVAKPLVNNTTYYMFDTKFNFGALTPQIISKRVGRINNQPIYIKKNKQVIAKLKQIIVATQKQKSISQKVNSIDQQNKSDAIKKLTQNESQSEESDSDDIFGEQSKSSNQSDNLKNKQKKRLFHFGKGLDFGIKDEQIFKVKQKNNQEQIELQSQNILQSHLPNASNKYDFLRKKVKTNDFDDGYGECYIQTGPSLQQMKEYRKQGIQLFGDAKQFKFKQKKVNIHKDYQKIKKIIQEKGKT